MSGDSVPFALPLQQLATSTGEATALYSELRKPLLRYLVCLGLSIEDVSIATDGSAQRLQLRPQLTGFEGGPNQ